MVVRCSFVVFLTIGPASLLAQQQFDDVKIEATHVAGKVYMLTGRGGNIGASDGPDGILIVDDQFAPLADKIRDAVEKISKHPGTIKFVLNTHWHGDHTGSNPIFGAQVPIIAHANVRKRLLDPPELFGRRNDPMVPEGLPVITFEESVSIHFNGEEIRVIHFPHGHTDGDSVVLFTDSNVVHLGDHFFAGRFPFVDLDSGGFVEGLAANIRRLIEMLPADVKIIPGHGPLSTIDDLRAYQDMLITTLAIVQKRMKAGQTLDEIQAAGFPENWQSWGTGFISSDRWIEIVHRSLSD